jgi:hypothetical protein
MSKLHMAIGSGGVGASSQELGTILNFVAFAAAESSSEYVSQVVTFGAAAIGAAVSNVSSWDLTGIRDCRKMNAARHRRKI